MHCREAFEYEAHVVFGIVRAVPSVCTKMACRTAEIERAVVEAENEAADEVERAMSAVPPMIRREMDQHPLIPQLSGWTPDQWFYLYGPVGTGKTTQMALVASRLAVAGVRFEWYRTRELIRAAQAAIGGKAQRPTILDNPTRPRVLLLDDFAVERATEYVIDQLGELVMARYDAGLTTGFTSNRSLTDIGKSGVEFDRVASRIAGMTAAGLGVLHLLEGDDHRGGA